MTRDCNCGGRFNRTDLVLDIEISARYNFLVYKDSDPFKCHWKCNKCGQTRTQRKRKSKKDVSFTNGAGI